MKKIAFIVLFLPSSMSWAQNFVVTEKPTEKAFVVTDKAVEQPEEEKIDEAAIAEFNELINYTPKAFIQNEKSKSKNRMLAGDLNSISSLELRYAYQAQLKLNAEEVKWMESEINQLAIAFFAEGKPIIIKKTGSYEGCIGQRVTSELKKGQNIKTLYFCYTCKGANDFEDRFIEIFNNRTEKLLAAKK